MLTVETVVTGSRRLIVQDTKGVDVNKNLILWQRLLPLLPSAGRRGEYTWT